MRLSLLGFVGVEITVTDIRRQLTAANGGPVDIDIATPGGYLDEAISIYNAIKDYKGRKAMRLVGTVASAGTLIALAGDRIEAMPASLWMVHASSTSASGNQADMLRAARVLAQYDALLLGVYCAKTKKSPEAIRADMLAETWYSPTEALEYGYIDAVLGETTGKNLSLLVAERDKYRVAASAGYRPGELERVAAMLTPASHAPRDPKETAYLIKAGLGADFLDEPAAVTHYPPAGETPEARMMRRAGVTAPDLAGIKSTIAQNAVESGSFSVDALLAVEGTPANLEAEEARILAKARLPADFLKGVK